MILTLVSALSSLLGNIMEKNKKGGGGGGEEEEDQDIQEKVQLKKDEEKDNTTIPVALGQGQLIISEVAERCSCKASSTGSDNKNMSSSSSRSTKDLLDHEVLVNRNLTFSSPEVLGFESLIKPLVDHLFFPFVNQKILSSLEIYPPTAILLQGPFPSPSTHSGLHSFVQAISVHLSNLRGDGIQYRMFERNREKTLDKFGGKGADFVRDIFQEGKKGKPCIIFIPEINKLCYYDKKCEANCGCVLEIIAQIPLLPRNGDVILIATNPQGQPDFDLPVFPLKIDLPKEFDLSTNKKMLLHAVKGWKVKPTLEIVDTVAAKLTGPLKLVDMKRLSMKAFKMGLERMLREKQDQGSSGCMKCACDLANIKIDENKVDTISPTLKDWTLACKEMEAESTTPTNSPYLIKVDPTISFEVVGGLGTQIQSLKENILFPFKHKEDLKEWGFQPVRGIIFHGPPGTGKTLIGKALATELNKHNGYSFIYHKGSEICLEALAKADRKLRELFEAAKTHKPCIIFLDEIDALCPLRSRESSEYMNLFVITFLSVMDQVDRGEVIVIGATNRLDSIDPAVLRPGRFDKVVNFHLPTEEGRLEILKIHTKSWKGGNSEEILDQVGKRTGGYTGADLEQLCRQAFVQATKRRVRSLDSSSSFDNFDILPGDWWEAKRIVKPSDSSVLDFVEMVKQPMPPGVTELMEDNIQAVLKKLRAFLVEPGNNQGSSSSSPFAGFLKSFLVWTSKDTHESLDEEMRVMESFFIPSLLQSSDLKHATVFTMDLSLPYNWTRQRISSVIKQATSLGDGEDSNKIRILFVPRINEVQAKVLAYSGTVGEDPIRYLIEEITNTTHINGEGNFLILATSGGQGPQDLEEKTKNIFKGASGYDSRSHQFLPIQPSLFPTLFDPILLQLPSEELKEKFNSTLTSPSLMRTKNLFDLLTLRGEVEFQISKNKGETDDGTSELKKILELFITGDQYFGRKAHLRASLYS